MSDTLQLFILVKRPTIWWSIIRTMSNFRTSTNICWGWVRSSTMMGQQFPFWWSSITQLALISLPSTPCWRAPILASPFCNINTSDYIFINLLMWSHIPMNVLFKQGKPAADWPVVCYSVSGCQIHARLSVESLHIWQSSRAMYQHHTV